MNLDFVGVDWYMNPAVWCYGIATVGFAAFAVHLSVGWKGSGRAILLLLAVALGAIWAASSVAFALTPSVGLWRAAHVFDVLRIACGVTFLAVVLLRSHHDRPPAVVQPRVALGVFSAVAASAVAAIAIGLPMPGQATLEGDMLSWGFAALLMLCLLGIVLAEQVYRHAVDTQRWNVQPLCIGLAGPFVLDVVIFSDALLFRTLDSNFWAVRGGAGVLAIPLLGLAARRNRDWSFDVSVSRGVIAGSTAVLVAGAYLVVVAAAGYYVRYFGGTWGKALQTIVFFAAILLLGVVAVSGTFRAKLRVLVAKNFFSYRYDYREEWLKFTGTLSSAGESVPIEEACVRALADLVESTGGGLWMRRDRPPGYVQVVRINQPRVPEIEAPDGDLPTFIARTGWVVEVPAVRRDPTTQGGFGLPAWLEPLEDAWLIVPLFVGEELIGFVVLEEPRVKMEVNWEVRDLLKTAGRQAASYLAMKTATEALLEARKFDAFNRMSAFVVHDLKNLVAQMQLLLRNAQKHHANPEFQRDMLETVEHVVERMNVLMRQLRSGETPVEGPRPLDLAKIVRRVQATRAAGRSGLTVEASEGVMALGHEDRLERVIGHLVQNGFDASGDNPKVSLRVTAAAEGAVVEVADNGAGMSADFVRERLFKPFQSTKTTGMGIGAYESQQYVQSLGGRIEVNSQPGAGTVVRVVLPPLRARGTALQNEEEA